MDPGAAAGERVRRAVENTIAGGSARVSRAWRRGSPLGPVHNRFSDDVGVVDFPRRRAQLSACGSDDGLPVRIYDHDLRLDRWQASGPWTVGGGAAPEASAVHGPFGFLEALASARPGAADLGAGEHRGEQVTRYAIRFPSPFPAPRLVKASWRLFRPRQGAPSDIDESEGEVWIDGGGRVRVFSGAIGPPPEGALDRTSAARRSVIQSVAGTAEEPIWDTTELWDYGVVTDIDLPPAETVRTPKRQGLIRAAAQLADPRFWKEVRELSRDYAENWRPPPSESGRRP
jgi:hypothetical protein